MPRRKGAIKRARVLGPYAEDAGFRIIIINDAGERDREIHPTRATAEAAKARYETVIRRCQTKPLKDAIEDYDRHLRTEKRVRPRAAEVTASKLRRFFPDLTQPVGSLDTETASEIYQAFAGRYSADYGRNTLATASRFLRWCIKEGLASVNPFEDVEPVGVRKRGKDQLRIDEARRWEQTALRLADEGDEGALAALMTLYFGLRTFEVSERQVRDVDDNASVIWIPDSKTVAGRRRLRIPPPLRPHLLLLIEGREGNEMLFGHHWPDWVSDQVRRICKLAKVPIVAGQSMRGLHSTMALEDGATAENVARSLGHADGGVTMKRHYARPGSVEEAQHERALVVLQGGK